MAIADNKALLSEIMNLLDDHVTAKASRELEKQLHDVLDGYEIATIIRDDSGDADNSQQLIDAFINASGYTVQHLIRLAIRMGIMTAINAGKAFQQGQTSAQTAGQK